MTDGYRCVISRPTQAFLGTERKFPKYTGGGKPGCSGFVNMSSKNCFINWTFQEIEKLQTKMKRGTAGFILARIWNSGNQTLGSGDANFGKVVVCRAVTGID